MDSRDIKEEPRIDNQFLESMFLMQEDLIKSYVRIESIPAPPIDINTKKSQSLIKDFSARIIEELSEGFESYEAIFKSLEDNQLYMRYFFIFRSSYKIDYINDYKTAVVANSDYSNLWIMSRAPSINKDELDNILKDLENKMDISKLTFTKIDPKGRYR